MWGFEPILNRAAAGMIPRARRGSLTLAADIRSTDGMDLLVMPTAGLNGTGEPVAIDSPQLLAAGRFTDPHPPEWKQTAYAAQSLLAVIGPSDAPVWTLEGPEKPPASAQRLVDL